MNIKHGGNVSKETADLIKQLEQSSGASNQYTMVQDLFLPDDWTFFDIYTTTSLQSIDEQFEWNQGKELNERLYELFKNGPLNAYFIGDSDELLKVEFNSIDENGEITLSVEGSLETEHLSVPKDTQEVEIKFTCADAINNTAVYIYLHKPAGEQP